MANDLPNSASLEGDDLELQGLPRRSTPTTLFIRFAQATAERLAIRKWSETPFEGADEYRHTDRAIYLIWSNEHQAWWRAGSAGYTVHSEQAGHYGRTEALKISASARDGWRRGTPPPEIAVPLADVLDTVGLCRAKGGYDG